MRESYWSQPFASSETLAFLLSPQSVRALCLLEETLYVGHKLPDHLTSMIFTLHSRSSYQVRKGRDCAIPYGNVLPQLVPQLFSTCNPHFCADSAGSPPLLECQWPPAGVLSVSVFSGRPSCTARISPTILDESSTVSWQAVVILLDAVASKM